MCADFNNSWWKRFDKEKIIQILYTNEKVHDFYFQFLSTLKILIKNFNVLKYRNYAEIDNKDRTNIFLISFHYLLHVADSIEDFGPCRGYWQFPMERMCGMLIPLVKSQIHPYANLWNNIVLNERFNHLIRDSQVMERSSLKIGGDN